MLVLGIDPGLSLTGWGIIDAKNKDNLRTIQYGCIKTFLPLSLSERLFYINSQLQSIVNQYKPDVCAIEELFFLKAAKSVAAVGQARGAIVLTLALNKIPLFEYNPRIVKVALTSYGSADKYQMQNMVKILLKLNEVPKPDDTADALAIAICHINTTNSALY
ncbi:MAG: crossover junction endodeoxyribonuclease RuvC [Elusimicrobiota bacterium]|jgi:crossover junction endodeoxyribonuclease RuvC|nr:crossover junction endodeoxyribonuclease RuvC [Elusimicrobiota bacterium]